MCSSGDYRPQVIRERGYLPADAIDQKVALARRRKNGAKSPILASRAPFYRYHVRTV
jgi:hypothetical protein